MSVYLDTNIIVAVFTNDALRPRARAFLDATSAPLVISDFAAAEFSAVLARLARRRQMTLEAARNGFANFDIWTARAVQRAETTATDVAMAIAVIRRLDLNLDAPDAIHIAIAQRIGAELATMDERMAASARAIGLPLAPA